MFFFVNEIFFFLITRSVKKSHKNNQCTIFTFNKRIYRYIFCECYVRDMLFINKPAMKARITQTCF